MRTIFIQIFLILINANGFLFFSQNVIDVRSTCLLNTSRNIYLPSGKGQTTSTVIYLSTKTVHPVCQFHIFSFLYDVGLVIVLELVGSMARCIDEIALKDDHVISICENFVENVYRYEKLVKNVTVLFNFKKNTSKYDIKLVIIAANLLANNLTKCDDVGKKNCKLRNQTLCIDKNLVCNGDFNCGVGAKLDEDSEICNAVGWKIWLVVICSVLFVIYSNFTIFHFFTSKINHLPEYFYNVDEAMVESSLKNPSRVKICRSQEHHTISLTNQIFKMTSPVRDNLTCEDKKIQDLPLNRWSSLNNYIDWTPSSNTSSKELDYRRHRLKNAPKWPPFMSGPMYPEETLSKTVKEKVMSSCEETYIDGIKITYYET